MIELIIPLNLPLRTVAVTEALASPPESLLPEMVRFAQRRSKNSRAIQEVMMLPVHQPFSDADHELEQLRAQRALFTAAIEELRRATSLVEERIAEAVHEFQVATIELALAISAKLVFEEIDANRFPMANLVHEVIGRLDASAAAVVRLHPDDLLLIQDHHLIAGSGDEHRLQFIADSNLARGDCKATAGEISVVYELQRQIAEIRRQLLSTVNGHAET